MRGGRNAVCRLGILGLLLLCCFLAKAAAAGTEKYSEGVSVRKTKGTWSPAEADSIRQEESEQEFPDSCIFWGERGEEVLENEKMDRMEQASVIEVLGDTQGLLAATAPLYEEDEDGCLLSEDLACRLFGSKYVMGEEISYRGRTLTVRGILRGMEGTAAVQAEKEGDSVLDTIAYEANTEGDSLESPVQAFLMRHGIQGKVQPWRYFAVCAELLVFLLPLVIFLRMAGRTADACRKMHSRSLRTRAGKDGRQRNTRIRTAGMYAVPVLMAVLFYWLFRPSLGVTRDMMPTKWSDFNFWRQTIQQIQNNLELLLQTKKTSLDLLVLRPFFSCLKYCVMAWLLYAVGYRWEKNAGTAEVLAGILLSWILLLGVICFLGDSGLYLAGEKRIWFWACFWLTGGYAADRMHAF